jgi:acyl transferase domain-containing protein
MLAVPLGESALGPYLQDGVEIAVLNTPTSTVVAGSPEALIAFTARLAADGLTPIPVATSHAFHSSLMTQAVAPFTEAVAGVPRHAPSRRWVSNLTGTWVTSEQAVAPSYWARHLREPVRFADGVATVLAGHEALVLEVGPGTTLGRFVRQHPSGRSLTPRASLAPADDSTADLDTMLLSLGALWATGAAVDWTAFWQGQTRSRISLPTYPFDRQRHWLDMIRETRPGATTGETRSPAPIPDVRRFDDWFEVPGWKLSAAWSTSAPSLHHWLVTADEAGVGDAIAAALLPLLRCLVDCYVVPA